MTVSNIEYEELSDTNENGNKLGQKIDLVKNVKVNLSVCIGDCEISVSELFDLKDGSVLEINKHLNEPVDVKFDNKVVARGELVVVDDNFGVKITEIENQ